MKWMTWILAAGLAGLAPAMAAYFASRAALSVK